MKIAIFTDTFTPELNGVANTLGYLRRYFDQMDVEYLFITPDYQCPAQEDCPNVYRIKGFQVPISPESRIVLPVYWRHRERIRQFNPDVIHVTTQFGIGRLGVDYAQEFGVPLVMSYHTNFDQYLKFHKLEFLDQPLWDYTKDFYAKGDVTLCPSQDTVDGLAQRGFGRLGIWSRGADLTAFNPNHRSSTLRQSWSTPEKLIFAYVGRLSAEKDLDIYLDAIRIVNQTMAEQIQFVFTGVGPYEAELQGVNLPNVILTGAKRGKALWETYASADAFVFPSGTETFGNVLLEAMASGLPTISVDAGGVRDFAVDGVNSLVCQHKNAQSLATAICRLADNQLLRQRLSQGALVTAKSRSWERIFENLMKEYSRVFHQNKKIAG